MFVKFSLSWFFIRQYDEWSWLSEMPTNTCEIDYVGISGISGGTLRKCTHKAHWEYVPTG